MKGFQVVHIKPMPGKQGLFSISNCFVYLIEVEVRSVLFNEILLSQNIVVVF